MKLLNLGCGGTRPAGPEWTNLDDLHAQLPPGSGARETLDREQNYLNFDVTLGPLPFADSTFDSVLASHFFEHFEAQEGLRIMRECRRVLKPGGVLLVSVPDASYFRRVYPEDRNENWPRLFETTDPNNPIPTFFEAALWFEQHRVILTEDALWCYFVRAGFRGVGKIEHKVERGDGEWSSVIATFRCPWPVDEMDQSLMGELTSQLNRLPFSLVMAGVKE